MGLPPSGDSTVNSPQSAPPPLGRLQGGREKRQFDMTSEAFCSRVTPPFSHTTSFTPTQENPAPILWLVLMLCEQNED